MRKYILIFVVLLSLFTMVASATVEITEDWNVTFDGGNDDHATSVNQTSDNGYILAGYTNNTVSNDMWLVKTNSTGSEEWNTTFSCGVTDDDIAYTVRQTFDGGYIVAGPIQNIGTRDMWIVKTNDTGSEEWNATFDSGFDDYATSVQLTSDGGYVVTGYTDNSADWDMWIVKTNDTGSEEWNVTFDGGDDDFARSIQQTSNGGYVVAGQMYNGTTSDIWIIKTNDTGLEEWNVTFNNSANKDYVRSVQQTSDDGYIAAGFTDYDEDRDIWLIRTNSTGSEQWNFSFDGGVEDDEAYSVQLTSEGGFVLAGYTENSENRDMWLIKTNSTGSEEWNFTFDSGGHDYAISVQQTNDGDYITAGYTNNSGNWDMLLAKINVNEAPVLTSIDDKSVDENELLTFMVNASDTDLGDTLNYTSDNLPTGATLNESTGIFSWTPTDSDVGAHSVNFTVSDGILSDSATINITVNNVKTGGGSSGGSSGSSGGGGGSTGEAYANIAFKDAKTKSIAGGHEITYNFDDEENPIRYIKFNALRNYQSTSTIIEVLKNRSEMVDESAPGFVYSNVNIWVGKAGFATEDNIADPVIGFRLVKDKITEHGIDESSIVMYRYSESEWNYLNTEKVGEDGVYIYFEAETPGFSPFAIGAEVDEGTLTSTSVSESDDEVSNSGNDAEPFDNEIPETMSNDMPGLSIFTSIFVLVLGCLFRKRKN